MTAHAARRLVKSTPRPDGSVDAEVELVCGCVITRVLDDNRLIVTEDGAQLVVGKYPCPTGHSVVRPKHEG
ncbi:MAG: hypothetical protein Q8S33_06110 [Myxococcales bacterium]|nr:hypothetical protein [Myxococcales bacterium]MDP3499884.1 hypothetical protein [Myxococcales bacterium]